MAHGRILYIDAMRGFTMLLVVYHHVLLRCGYNDIFSFNDVFVVFRMPLFFFVSGFVLYNDKKIWDLKFSSQFLHKKFNVQIVSTLLFLLLSDLIFQNNVIDSLFSFVKNGYWFTIALFEFFVLFALIEFFICKFKIKKHESVILILFALVVVFTPFLSYILPSWNLNECKLYNLFGVKQFYFFIYFIFGVLVRKHFGYFEKYVFSDKTFALFLIVFTLSFVCNYLYNSSTSLLIIARLLGAFLGILIVFSVFKKYSSFCETSFVGKSLQYIGRRTLDIYLLHYFFLPKNVLIFLPDDIISPVSEFVVVGLFSIVTLFFSLVVSGIIRVSPSLAHLLFGVKKQN